MDERDEGDTPFPESLCHGCAHLSLVRTGRGSAFLRCLEPSLPKYLPQPVTTCRAFARAQGEGEG